MNRLRAALNVASSPSEELIPTHPAAFWTDADAAERATLEQRIVLVLAVHNALTLPQLAYLVGDVRFYSIAHQQLCFVMIQRGLTFVRVVAQGVAQNGRLTPEFTQALCSTCLLCSHSSSWPSDGPSRPASANMDTFQLHPAAGVARLPSQGHPALQGPISPAQHAQLLQSTPHITPPSSSSDHSLLSWTSWLCRRKAWCVNTLAMMKEDRASALQRRQEDWNDTAPVDNSAASTRIPGITRQLSTGAAASKRGGRAAGADVTDARASRARGSTKRKQPTPQPDTPSAVPTTATDNRSHVAATVATASDKSALASRIRTSLGITTSPSEALTTGSAAQTSGKKPPPPIKSATSMGQVASNGVRPSMTSQAAKLHPFGPPPQDHDSSDSAVERVQGLLRHCDVALHAPVAPLLSPLRRVVDGEARRDLLTHLHEQLVELVAEGHDKTELRCGKLVLTTSQWLHKAETVLLQVKRRLREYDGFGELTAAMVADLF